ncbi:hypothetical protein SS50377_22706 [Spironucleus salmonicida]|uniref:Uncharacterized protein n=1 Tax=Spironucleus salmonicida TaxID=348837 RepID=V6LTU6_9EUKA|nr:hypothetical protein SS50377_22706 [Spironucleus salmonicida]|eukprot:EST44184.1 Hypothetical protein SS50377_15989 [Spironucleus salmonicida]
MSEEHKKCVEWYSNIQQVYKTHISGIGVVKADMNAFAPISSLMIDLVQQFDIASLKVVGSMKLGNFAYFKAQEGSDFVKFTTSQDADFAKIFAFPEPEFEFITIVACTNEQPDENAIKVGQLARDLVVDGLSQ